MPQPGTGAGQLLITTSTTSCSSAAVAPPAACTASPKLTANRYRASAAGSCPAGSRQLPLAAPIVAVNHGSFGKNQ